MSNSRYGSVDVPASYMAHGIRPVGLRKRWRRMMMGRAPHILNAGNIEQLRKDEDAGVLQDLTDQAAARRALCRLCEETELLQCGSTRL